MSEPNKILIPNINEPMVDVRSFAEPNTPADGNVNWQPMIQGAINYLLDRAKLNNSPGTLYIPPGTYRIDTPIEISKIFEDSPGHFRYTDVSIQICGNAPSYGGGTIIKPTFTEFPAIVIEGARSVVLRNLTIVGLNNWTTGPTPPRNETQPETHYDESNYLFTPLNHNPVRTSLQSPYAGIHIDPFDNRFDTETHLPLDGGYPYPSSEPQRYVQGFASVGVHIEKCYITGFVVGVAIALSGSSDMGGAEGIAITDSYIVTTKTAIASGQQQSRMLTLTNIYIHAAKYAINCAEYGRSGGDCPSIFGANIGGVKYVFNTFSSASTPSINGLYCEAIMSIGQLDGSGQAQDGHVFNACNFSFMQTPSSRPALFRLRSRSTTIFNGCQFSCDDDGVEPMWFLILGVRTAFHNCYFPRNVAPVPDYPSFYALGPNGWSDRVSFDGCMMRTSIGDPADPVGSFPASAPLSTVQALSAFTNHTITALLPGSFFYELTAPSDSLRWIAGGFRMIPIGVNIDLTVASGGSSGTATFTLPNNAIGRVRPGDFIFSETPYTPFEGGAVDSIPLIVGRVVSVDASSHLVTLVNVPEAVTAGSAAATLSVAHWPRAHYPTRAEIPANSSTITVQDGLGAFWAVGNRILAENSSIVDGTFITRKGSIVDGVFAAAGNSVGNVLELSQPTKNIVSLVPVRIYDADVREVSTVKL